MELRQLEHFAAVAKYLSFTRAAREVHVAQSSLSVSVRQLERELEASLFERTTRRVALTPAGRALLPTAQRMLMDVHTARESIAAVSGMLCGQVTVGTIQALTWVDLPAGLSRFHRAHPGVNITLQEAPVDELLDELLAGDLDLAYIARDGSRLPEGTSVIATHHEELVVVTAHDHPLAHQHHVLLPDLQQEPFVDFQAGTGLQTVVAQLCAQAGLDRKITLRATQLQLLISLVNLGLGTAIIPAPIAERTDLARIRIAPPRPHRTVALVAREREPSNPAALALLHELHGADLQRTLLLTVAPAISP